MGSGANTIEPVNYSRKIFRLKTKLIRLFLSKEAKRHQLVGNPKYWRLKQSFQIEFLKQRGLKADHYLLDLGSGTLRGGVPIIKYLDQGHYYGIEVRQDVLEEGRREAIEQGLAIKSPQLIHFLDFDDLDLDVKFNVIFAFSVLIHMTDEIVEKGFQFVARHLKPGGVFYANVNLDKAGNGFWQGFPVMHKDVSFYEKLASDNGLSLESLGPLKKLGHNTGDACQDSQIMLAITKH